MNKYFLHVDAKKANHAGSKAVEDCEAILEDCGYIKKKAYSSFAKISFIRKIIKGVQLLKLYCLPLNSVLVIQHPLYIDNRYLNDIKKLKEKRDLNVIFIIHDLESIRKSLGNYEMYKEKDELMVEIADVIIAHNSKMVKEICSQFNFPENNIVSLEVFDYLLKPGTDVNQNKKDKKMGVMIVGNLSPEKVGYLYSDKFKTIVNSFYLFGPNYDCKKLPEGNYFGQFSPDEIVEKLEGSFGLVWDGNSPDTCEGSVGEYIKINNPHKVSMYIAAHYPIIIWEKAALADFVISNKIGITVKNLWEIPNKQQLISDDEYKTMVENITVLSEKVTSGYYLEKALEKAIEMIKKK